MTLDEVRARVEAIRKLAPPDVMARDDEGAHQDEDALYCDVLRAIASGRLAGQAAIDCAAEALKTQEFDFSRWYA